ncbi:MAG: PqqD family protein [Thermoanaerobaculaceae bacterium]|jgi:hypothetical protein
MNMDVVWQPGAQVISETLEGEAVIINLETGCYYSLDRLASWIWTAIAAGGATGRAIVQTLARACSREEGDVAAVLTPFLATLVGEGLVVEGGGPSTEAFPSFDPAIADLAEPQLKRFDDIQELLLLDPIHEVEEEGWPVQRPLGQDDRT